ncbi:MAG: endo alpha-1,4 polygalactosaminidase [Ilumatobacteraceae bacterium]
MRRSAHSRLLATLLAPALLTVACTGDDDGGGDGGDDETIEFSGDSSPGASASVSVDGETVLAIVGDAGELNDDTLAVAALVRSADPTAVFTVGDNEYVAEGRTVDAYEESVGRVYGQWLDGGTFFPIPGDHDYGDQCGAPDAPADLDAYLEYFDLPAGPEDETYYDVRIADVHVFALDSMPECHRDGGAKLARQQAWLAETATASDAALKIVLLHNPPYSSGISHGSVEELRWDFAGWGVDLVVSGDDHIYERSTHAGVPYVVNGLGGVEAHEIGDPIDGSEVLYGDAFGALFVTVTGTVAEAAFVIVDGEEIDRFPLDAGTAGDPGTGARSHANDAAVLTAASTWQWQLQGELDTSYDVDVYDVDLFETDPSMIADLRAEGRVVVCYFSVGSYESWRPDADSFASEALGEPLDGFEDERWLDVRDPSVRTAAEGRLDLAVEQGCHGVEPDNVDGYTNNTGFDLTGDDQLAFNRFLADEAADRGLLIGLKNDLDQIADLVDVFDFAVNEQCHEFDECEVYAAFVDRAKPVFNAEYAGRFVDDPDSVCARSIALGLRTLLLPLDLDNSFRISCDDR